jgi:predicted transcriptional regulator
MSTKDATYKIPRIQKFKGKFNEVDGGVTTLFTKTIQSITDTDCLAIYVYLSSKPANWKINVEEINSHFVNVGRDKVRKCLNDLCLIGVLKRKKTRTDKGVFMEDVFYLYLSPAPENQVVDHPAPRNPAPANPALDNQGPYKEEIVCIERKECKKALIKTPSQEHYQDYEYFKNNRLAIPEKLLYVKEWFALNKNTEMI